VTDDDDIEKRWRSHAGNEQVAVMPVEEQETEFHRIMQGRS
jgi:ParB-like chromosome segregation protein Spo0J